MLSEAVLWQMWNPTEAASDNSKTFKLASRILLALQKAPEVRQHLRDSRIEWSFILEKAPWWGGFYERLIQSVRKCLRKVVGRARLSYDELITILVEVEATLNSRPISYLSSEDFEEPLTPSLLLIGHRVVTLPNVEATHEGNPDFGDTDTRVDLARRMRHLSQVMEQFWKRWRSEYLTALRERHSYNSSLWEPRSKVAVGDVVLIYDPDQPRTTWRMGKVETLLESEDGAVRGASLRVSSGSKSASLRRPIQHLYPKMRLCYQIV